MIKKRQISMTVCGVLFLVLLIAYIAVIRPLTRPEEEKIIPPDLIEGESLDSTGQYRLIFPRVPREKIKEIKVSGAEGEYRIEREVVEDEVTFVINGYKGITYKDEAFSALVVASGYPITRDRLTEKGTEEEFTRYGLDEPQLTWTLTDVQNNEYTVHVGDRLVSGEGYYAYLEGREAIYILSSNIESSLLLPVEYFVNPVVSAGMTQDSYFKADNFILAHGSDAFIAIKHCEKEEFSNPDAQAETKLIYPAGYKTDDGFYFNIMAGFMSLIGEEAVYFGEDPEEMKKYGIDLENEDTPSEYSVYFTYFDKEYFIFISEKTEDGYYYATSNLTDYKVISKVPADSLKWLEADLADWVYEYPIMLNIAYVDSISVDIGGENILFTLHHGIDENDKATLFVEGDNGFSLRNSDVYNFREFYKVLLSVQIMGDSELSDEEKEELVNNDDALMGTVTFNMKDGEVNEYKFYRYSTRRALITVNGDGTFYVVTDWIEKIGSDLGRLLSGLEVDSFTKN